MISGNAEKYLPALGIAQYRVQQFSEALETLNEIPHPRSATVLAFLAMANHQLGHVEQAAQLLDEARERASGDDSQSPLIDEVESLLEIHQ